jgi:hypothetical protein
VGIASSLYNNWRNWSYAEQRRRLSQELNMNMADPELDADREELQEELDLLPAYILKAERAFRAIENQLKAGTYASVNIATQLLTQKEHPRKRDNLSLIKKSRPKKRKRSSAGGATSPEEAHEQP